MMSRMMNLTLVALASLTLQACDESPSSSSSGTSCAELCERIEAPECPFTAPDCIAACEDDKGGTPAACQSKLDALSRCFAQATFTCDVDGIPVADACQDELSAWTACREQGSDGAQGDAGGGADQCAPAAGDDACEACLKDSCCDQLSACNGSCQNILACLEDCAEEDDACIEACVQANLDGAVPFANLTSCTYQACPGSCELSE